MHATLHSKPILQFSMPSISQQHSSQNWHHEASIDLSPGSPHKQSSILSQHSRDSSKMQGVKGGGDPPKPDGKELESESAKQMRKAGFERAQAEDWQKKGVMEKIQATTSHIKDAAAEKMDQLAGATTTTTK